MFPVVSDDFLDDKPEELLGETGVEPGVFGEPRQARDLGGLPLRIGGGEVVFGLEPADRLGVGEAFGERVDENRVEAVDAGSVVQQHLGGTGGGVGHAMSSGAGWRQIVMSP